MTNHRKCASVASSVTQCQSNWSYFSGNKHYVNLAAVQTWQGITSEDTKRMLISVGFRLQSLTYLFILTFIYSGQFLSEPSSLFREHCDHTHTVTHIHTWKLPNTTTTWSVGHSTLGLRPFLSENKEGGGSISRLLFFSQIYPACSNIEWKSNSFNFFKFSSSFFNTF